MDENEINGGLPPQLTDRDREMAETLPYTPEAIDLSVVDAAPDEFLEKLHEAFAERIVEAEKKIWSVKLNDALSFEEAEKALEQAVAELDALDRELRVLEGAIKEKEHDVLVEELPHSAKVDCQKDCQRRHDRLEAYRRRIIELREREMKSAIAAVQLRKDRADRSE